MGIQLRRKIKVALSVINVTLPSSIFSLCQLNNLTSPSLIFESRNPTIFYVIENHVFKTYSFTDIYFRYLFY